MAQDRVHLCLNNANQTEITINDMTIDDVLDEFHAALAEQRCMRVGMENPGYVHRVNPLNVTHIYTLNY